MKVTLLSYTPDALNLLLFTRSTRLQMSLTGFEEVMSWPEGKKYEELEKMRNTIQSSWEFIDYIFTIEDVTRAFTHQLVRHRVGTSFAQQAQRAVDMSGFTYETGPSIQKSNSIDAEYEYDGVMKEINRVYKNLVDIYKINPQDARGILPTNIHTNITFKANLRTLHDMGLKRLCVKTQGEFQNVFREIREEVIKIHPWAKDFIKVNCAWNGTCCFPTFPVEDCYVKRYVHNPLTPGLSYDGGTPASLDKIEDIWGENRGEAQPKI